MWILNRNWTQICTTPHLLMARHWKHKHAGAPAGIDCIEWVSEWLNLTAFMGTADSEVHIVHWLHWASLVHFNRLPGAQCMFTGQRFHQYIHPTPIFHLHPIPPHRHPGSIVPGQSSLSLTQRPRWLYQPTPLVVRDAVLTGMSGACIEIIIISSCPLYSISNVGTTWGFSMNMHICEWIIIISGNGSLPYKVPITWNKDDLYYTLEPQEQSFNEIWIIIHTFLKCTWKCHLQNLRHLT